VLALACALNELCELCVICVHRCVGAGVCIERTDVSHSSCTHCFVVFSAAGQP